MILDMEGQVKLIALWHAMFHAVHVHQILVIQEFKKMHVTHSMHTAY